MPRFAPAAWRSTLALAAQKSWLPRRWSQPKPQDGMGSTPFPAPWAQRTAAALPHDFPHWNTVYGYFAKWQKEGVFVQLNGLLRDLVRQREGRDGEPSACAIDAQSVKASTSVHASSQGIDAGGTSSPTRSACSWLSW